MFTSGEDTLKLRKKTTQSAPSCRDRDKGVGKTRRSTADAANVRSYSTGAEVSGPAGERGTDEEHVLEAVRLRVVGRRGARLAALLGVLVLGLFQRLHVQVTIVVFAAIERKHGVVLG